MPEREFCCLNDFEFMKCIGKGGSSEVYLGKITNVFNKKQLDTKEMESYTL